MATIQTRKSVSIRGDTYRRLKNYSEATGQSMSSIVEGLVKGILNTPIVDKSAEERLFPV